jgi:hypothetical protein
MAILHTDGRHNADRIRRVIKMQATVVKVEDGKVTAIGRRSSRPELLHHRHYDLKVGDKVEVKRVTNNPYLVRVQ